MNLLKYIWMTKADAIRYGFTHEGTLYGLPAYLKHEDGETFIACPKVPLLQFVAMTIDGLVELFTWIVPGDYEVETPHSFGKPLVQKPTTPEKQA